MGSGKRALAEAAAAAADAQAAMVMGCHGFMGDVLGICMVFMGHIYIYIYICNYIMGLYIYTQWGIYIYITKIADDIWICLKI